MVQCSADAVGVDWTSVLDATIAALTTAAAQEGSSHHHPSRNNVIARQ
jgi:hypothetical protein